MEEPEAVTEVVRDFAADLRAVMAALLRARPRHVRLVSANAYSVRCVFSTAADGFRVGQPVTAELKSVDSGIRVSIGSGGEALHPRVRDALDRFLDEVDRGLQASRDTLSGC